MRKLFSLFVALLATTTLWAYDFKSGDLYYTITSSSQKTVEVVYISCVTTAIIPETVTYYGTTYSVTSIGYLAFPCPSLTSITIPNSVTSIGWGAFEDTGIYKDESNWENDVLYIDNCLIKARTSISGTYAIKENTRLIADDAFSDCSSLTSITIPNSVTSIGDWAFYGCSSLTSVTIGNSVTSIGVQAFYDCSSLTSVTIGNSVTSIGYEAFYNCSSLNSITIPNSVTSIGDWAFSNCSSLTSPVYNAHCFAYMPTSYSGAYTIPEGIEQIAGGAFSHCSSLTSVTIPNSVTTVGGGMFYWCSKLESVVLSNNIISLPCYSTIRFHGNHEWYDIYGFFENCFSLTSITIPNSVTSIGDCAFSNCSSLTSITIPNSVTSIGDLAFRYCDSLTSITIPNSVTTVGGGMFFDCDKLESVVLSNNMISLPCYSQKKWHDYVGWVYDIYGFFESCSSLTSVTIGNSVTSIGDRAFHHCSSLSSVAIGNGVTHIDEYVFYGCAGLNLLRLGTGIQSIAANAFSKCTKLYDIYCLAAEPPTGYTSSFANYNAFIHVPCESQRLYMLDVLFGEFKYIECIEAETTPTDTVVVTPSFNDAEFIWPSNSSADSYTLAISKDGEVFCTLTFNANGQLTGIAFAPSRNGQHNAPAAAQTANGFAFTVTGLDEGSNYTYELLIQDRSGNTLQSYSGEFRTQSTNDRTVTVEYDAAQGQVTGAGTYLVGDTVTLTAIPNDGYRFVRWSNEVVDNPYTFVITENIVLSAEFEKVIATSIEHTHSQSPMTDCQKIIHNGQLLILRDGKIYTVMGQEL